jgi:hypothetical protein
MNRTQPARAIAVSLVTVMLLSGCGAARTLLGIHEAPKANTTSPALTVDQADAILVRVFTAVYQGQTGTGALASAALEMAYTGEGLRAERARVKLASTQPEAVQSPLLAPQRPQLLALSRGIAFPRFILAQSVSVGGGLPVLHLLTCPDAATPYRIAMSAEMVPPATVKPFDPLTHGSHLVSDGTGLPVTPTALLTTYAAQLAFPAKHMTNPPFAADSFSSQLRSGAASAAKAVVAQATFAQVHKVVSGSVSAVQQASGDALVLGVLERTDSFAVKPGRVVTTAADKAFVLLSGRKKVTKSASITTLEFLVFEVPRSSGQARLVAAREQVVAGSGS